MFLLAIPFWLCMKGLNKVGALVGCRVDPPPSLQTMTQSPRRRHLLPQAKSEEFFSKSGGGVHREGGPLSDQGAVVPVLLPPPLWLKIRWVAPRPTPPHPALWLQPSALWVTRPTLLLHPHPVTDHPSDPPPQCHPTLPLWPRSCPALCHPTSPGSNPAPPPWILPLALRLEPYHWFRRTTGSGK